MSVREGVLGGCERKRVFGGCVPSGCGWTGMFGGCVKATLATALFEFIGAPFPSVNLLLLTGQLAVQIQKKTAI